MRLRSSRWPSEMAIGAAAEGDRIAVGADEARRPPTLDRFADERQRHTHRRGRGLEGGRGNGCSRSQKLIVVAASRRNFEQTRIGCNRRARGPRQRQGEKTGPGGGPQSGGPL